MVSKPNIKYPIGKFDSLAFQSSRQIGMSLDDILTLPMRLRSRLQSLKKSDFEIKIREDGWNIRQIVHHLGDVYLNYNHRFKHILLNPHPVISTFDQEKWALLADYELPIDCSLILIEGICEHINVLLKNLNEDQFQKTYRLSGTENPIFFRELILRYIWHVNHHYAQLACLVGEIQFQEGLSAKSFD